MLTIKDVEYSLQPIILNKVTHLYYGDSHLVKTGLDFNIIIPFTNPHNYPRVIKVDLKGQELNRWIVPDTNYAHRLCKQLIVDALCKILIILPDNDYGRY